MIRLPDEKINELMEAAVDGANEGYFKQSVAASNLVILDLLQQILDEIKKRN
jgi:hypothetical protein